MPAPTILFGAFDRHNFGDLLFPHIAAALLPGRPLIFAGLAGRDLRPFGGHRVPALAQLATEWHDRPVRLIHVGGELLTCNAWQAALMLQSPDAAPALIARLDTHPAARQNWARQQLGLTALAPYCVPRRLFPAAERILYCGVGGVDLADSPAALRHEVLASLRSADAIGVRDPTTLAHLGAAGISARLMPDPAVLLAELFTPAIEAHGRCGEVAALRKASPDYLAVQLGADFGDDATLTEIAAQLDQAAAACGCAIALFRAGSAPWHDDLDCLRRLAARLHTRPVHLFGSLNLWDICALIAHSRAYCGSSLHGRIAAMAFGLPRTNFIHPDQGHKQAAFAQAWDAGQPGAVEVRHIADALAFSRATRPAARQHIATEIAARYRQDFAALEA